MNTPTFTAIEQALIKVLVSAIVTEINTEKDTVGRLATEPEMSGKTKRPPRSGQPRRAR